MIEAQQNFEALNSQLIEDLPKLTLNCSLIFIRSFNIYLNQFKSINTRVTFDLKKIADQVNKNLNYY